MNASMSRCVCVCVEALSRRSYVGVGWWRRKVCTVFMWKDPQCTSGIKSVYRVLGGGGEGGGCGSFSGRQTPMRNC